MLEVVRTINGVLWGWPMMILLLGFGILATIVLRVPQITRLKEGFKSIFQKGGDKNAMSSFQSLATAVGGQVGTGNIVGIATAIASGGEGAVFWMWVTSFIGMATISVEATLASYYRTKKDGEYIGGPAYYISLGLRELGLERFAKVLGASFAVFMVIAHYGTGNMVQSNVVAGAMADGFGISPLASGIFLAVMTFIVFMGGAKSIATFASGAVPFMAIFYIIGSVVILVTHRAMVMPVFYSIFTSAFTSKAVAGAVTGYTVKEAIRYGVARGLFSNEAGMGSAPHSFAAADTTHPARQGASAMVGVLITLVICTFTALVVLVTKASSQGLDGSSISSYAFQSTFGSLGSKFLAIAILFFAFTTIIGWYYYGELNVKFLFKSKIAIWVDRVVFLGLIVYSSIEKVDLVWEISDMFNAFLIIPNVIGLLFLLKKAKDIHFDLHAKDMKYEIK